MEPPLAGQTWNADGYAADAAFVPALGADVLSLLCPKAGERVLDVGCGDGQLTRRLVEAGADVVGLEPDPSLSARAREAGLDVMVQDAHEAFSTEPFDAVFSNAALHWMREPTRVLTNIHAALRAGGRFVAEQGGFGNVAAVRTAIVASVEAAGYPTPPEPWDFPTVDEQADRLQTIGFEVRSIALLPRPTALPTGMIGWLRTFADPYLAAVAPEDREGIVENTEQRLRASLLDRAGGWHADYVRLRFHAVRV